MEEAGAIAERASDRNPNSGYWWFIRGNLATTAGNFPVAFQHFTRAIQLHSVVFGSRHHQVAVAEQSKADIAGVLGRYAEALQSINAALSKKSVWYTSAQNKTVKHALGNKVIILTGAGLSAKFLRLSPKLNSMH